MVRDALRSPIPEFAVARLVGWTKELVNRVLVAIGEAPRGWVVRVLDTDPKVVNAFVNGGRYIYVFMGLSDQM